MWDLVLTNTAGRHVFVVNRRSGFCVSLRVSSSVERWTGRESQSRLWDAVASGL